jgi:hypothetical protein
MADLMNVVMYPQKITFKVNCGKEYTVQKYYT